MNDNEIWQTIEKWKIEKTKTLISVKQYDYILKLFEASTISNYLEWLNNLLKLNLNSLEEIPKNRASFVINSINKFILINKLQIINLLQRGIELKYCNLLFKKNITSYNELSLSEYNILMKGNKKFTIRSIDIPIILDDCHEYGYQYSSLCKDNKMYYLKFNNLVILDFDDISLEQIESELNKCQDLTFAIYKTYNGYHVFLLSQLMNYADQNTYNFMRSLNCDPYYCLFVQNSGFKIRLTVKLDRHEEKIAQFVKYFGSRENINHECQTLLKIHDQYIESANNKIEKE